MQRCGRLGWIIGVILLSVRPATADPVRITDGALDMVSTVGSLLLQGEEFILTGGVSATDGVFQPWQRCNLIPSCTPGRNARSGRALDRLQYPLGDGDA